MTSPAHILFLTCPEATFRIVQGLEFRRNTLENFRLNMHLKICPTCRNFKLQNQMIDSFVSDFEARPVRISESLRQRIVSEIQKISNK